MNWNYIWAHNHSLKNGTIFISLSDLFLFIKYFLVVVLNDRRFDSVNSLHVLEVE